MPSNIHHVDFHMSNRILRQMMSKASYVTFKMKPLSGPLFQQSQLVLQNFMSGVIPNHGMNVAPLPNNTAAYGTP
ncbi:MULTISPECIES: hypothetical protein [Ochrobactrum]|uniref:Uncharacterized protein n=1 Tax=Ochrobactrum chromiisoli TaxID=2993941 RepID=A0ABT3QPL9_9HYPH|nr:hypothetical protein [Ochrobactrum chromiisoli]MCX2697564.1 hypothetical protein [Ochrobactrum chromiisoli]